MLEDVAQGEDGIDAFAQTYGLTVGSVCVAELHLANDAVDSLRAKMSGGRAAAFELQGDIRILHVRAATDAYVQLRQP